MGTILIYGLECTIPDPPPLTKIDGHKLPIKKQKFRRVELPDSFEDVEFDDDQNPIYSDEQLKIVDRELDRCRDGYWFMNNGVPTYLTGIAYMYYTYWILENAVHPEYRESDRLFFIFLNTCLRHPQIKGLVRIKNRRMGATSMGTCIETHIAIFSPNKKCGNVSKTDTDARKLFNDMIVFGFYHLPAFLRPRVDTASTNKNELHFIKPAKKGKEAKGRKIEGLNSKMDFASTTLGAYDSTRLSFLILDEAGKWEKVNILSYHDVAIECVSEGARKKGFIYMPSTVNEPKKGGANFKPIWDNSDHIKYGVSGTSTSMVRFFMPSYECLAGFFDEYGRSVVDPPDKETLKYLVSLQLKEEEEERIATEDLAKGAKQYLADQLAKLSDQERIDAFKRKYPIKESDSFSFGSTTSPFNTAKIQAQIDWLTENPVPLRRGDLYPDIWTKEISFADNPKGKWLIRNNPTEPNAYVINETRQVKVASPQNSHKYMGGVDTFRFDKTKTLGSNGVIWIGTKFDASDESSGELESLYIGRPEETDLFWKEILMAAMWYGAKMVVEKDATQEYKKYFKNTMPNLLDANCNGFLSWTPDAAIDENRKVSDKNKYDLGASSADPFTFAKEIELAQAYIQRYCHKIYFMALLMELKDFDPDDRTKADMTIGFMMWLLGITGEAKAKKAEARREPLIQSHPVAY